MLLLGDTAIAHEFSDRLGPERLAAFDDPYEALDAMAQRCWRKVIVAACYSGLSGLCRAIRRLQHGARVIVLCGPAAEPEVRSLTGTFAAARIVDDYLIYPLNNGDWDQFDPAPPGDSDMQGHNR